MEDKILDIIANICEDDGVRTERDLDLFEESLLDSLAFIQMLVEFESQLGVVIHPTEIDHEDMNTVNKIISQVKARIN
jgi:D-alanine--poly(phosphoribitol) ligase subunit 2